MNPDKFITGLANIGISHLVVVPCSFAKDLINSCINNSKIIKYIPCASEAIACSVASGLTMSGKKPLVILQSSGLTNMGSCLTSLTKPYDIYFPIISSWRTYKEGDSEIQHKHLALNLPKLIDAYGYKYYELDDNIPSAIEKINESFKKHQILIINKNSFSFCELKNIHKLDLSQFPKRSEYLSILNNYKSIDNQSIKFIGTTGNTAREMYHIMKNTQNFYMAGNMGGALSVGFGCTAAGDKVCVCGGDAEFTMHLGGLTTIGRYQNSSSTLLYIVFDNEMNKSTGYQNSFQQHLDYNSIANASGWFTKQSTIKDLKDFSEITRDIFNNDKGFYFLHVKCNIDGDYARPSAKDIFDSKNFLEDKK